MKSLQKYLNESSTNIPNFAVVGAFYYHDGTDGVELVGLYDNNADAKKAMDKWWSETEIEDGEEGVEKKQNCYSAYIDNGWAMCKIIKIASI